ncbi:MAG: hypothetical protein MI810_25340 [Flavobacteriales bacterium]|nr:hypothetical protein [Flavobacteriales bacterium]
MQRRSLKKIFDHNQKQINGETIFGNILEPDLSFLPKRFLNCTFQGNVSIEVGATNLTFINCQFLGQNHTLSIRNNKKKIRFEGCNFEGNLSIKDIDTVEIVNTSIDESLSILEGNYSSILINNTLSEKKKIQHIYLETLNGDESKIKFINLDIGHIHLPRLLRGKITLWEGNYNKIHLNECEYVNKLEISGRTSNGKPINIQELHMPYLNHDGDILIEFAEIGKLNMNSFLSKKGTMHWQSIKFKDDAEVMIQHSNLENVQWNGIDFKNAKLLFDWSVFSKMEIANITWPNKRILHPNLVYPQKNKDWFKSWFFLDVLKEREEKFSIQREIYRQLKSISLKNYNNIDALAFYRNEMRVYWTYIRLKGGENWWDQLLIFLNRYVSNFGQSYALPLLWLLLFHWIFYSCVISWNYSMDWGAFKNGLGEYFYLLNPVHKSPDYINTGMGKFTEFFMRVFSGFFIYHFIKATRKFGKM